MTKRAIVILLVGVNLKFLAQYCGTSVAMIETRYGRFLESGEPEQLRRLFGDSGGERARAEVAKPSTVDGRRQNPQRNRVSPTGFERVAWRLPATQSERLAGFFERASVA